MTTKLQTQICLLQLVTDILSTPEMAEFLGTNSLGKRLADIHASLELRTKKLGITLDGKQVLHEMAKAIWRVTEFCLESDSPARLVVFNAILDSYAKGEIHYGEEDAEVQGHLKSWQTGEIPEPNGLQVVVIENPDDNLPYIVASDNNGDWELWLGHDESMPKFTPNYILANCITTGRWCIQDIILPTD